MAGRSVTADSFGLHQPVYAPLGPQYGCEGANHCCCEYWSGHPGACEPAWVLSGWAWRGRRSPGGWLHRVGVRRPCLAAPEAGSWRGAWPSQRWLGLPGWWSTLGSGLRCGEGGVTG